MVESDGLLNVHQKAALDALVRELLPLAAIPDLRYVRPIRVVRDGQVASSVNALLGSGQYAPGPHVATAVAVPVERDGELECHILVSASKAESLTPETYHPNGLVSTLLEELLHTRIYVTTWQQNGFLYPPRLSSCERDLFTLARKVHDEHFVNRVKAAIFASQPLIDEAGGRGLTTCNIWYPPGLAQYLDVAAERITQTMRAVTYARSVDKRGGWGAMIETIYRFIFEPLTRDSAFRAGNPVGVEGPLDDVANSRFYRSHVRDHWNRVRTQLDRSFESDLSEMTSATREMQGVFRDFLGSVGVKFVRRSDGADVLQFHSVPIPK